MQDGSQGKFTPESTNSAKVQMSSLTFLIALGIICFTILGIISLITGNPIIKG